MYRVSFHLRSWYFIPTNSLPHLFGEFIRYLYSFPPNYDVSTCRAPPDVFCIQARYKNQALKFVMKISSSCKTLTAIKSRSTAFLKFGTKASLKKLRNLILRVRRGLGRFQSLLRALDLLKLASRCLRTLIRKTAGSKNYISNCKFACFL